MSMIIGMNYQNFMSYFEIIQSIIQTKDSLFIVKDSYGVRPFFMLKINTQIRIFFIQAIYLIILRLKK